MQHDTCVFEQSLSFSFRSIGWPAIYARNISLTFVLFIIIALLIICQRIFLVLQESLIQTSK